MTLCGITLMHPKDPTIVRRARDFTQEELAELLGIKQTSVSKIERSHERHADLYVFTLRRFIEAMGGQLKISAVFPDGNEVPIDNFRQIDSSNSEGDSSTEEKTPDDRQTAARIRSSEVNHRK